MDVARKFSPFYPKRHVTISPFLNSPTSPLFPILETPLRTRSVPGRDSLIYRKLTLHYSASHFALKLYLCCIIHLVCLTRSSCWQSLQNSPTPHPVTSSAYLSDHSLGTLLLRSPAACCPSYHPPAAEVRTAAYSLLWSCGQ